MSKIFTMLFFAIAIILIPFAFIIIAILDAIYNLYNYYLRWRYTA